MVDIDNIFEGSEEDLKQLGENLFEFSNGPLPQKQKQVYRIFYKCAAYVTYFSRLNPYNPTQRPF